MPSHVPRVDATKKRAQLSRRKKALISAIRENRSHEDILRAAEDYRTSYLSFVKAKLHWAREARIVGTARLGKGAGSLRLKAASAAAQSDVDRLESQLAAWSAKSAEDVLHESGFA